MTEKKPRGRPAYQPTDKDRHQVKALSAMGATRLEISLVMQICEKTLDKYFAHEMAVGEIEASAKVAQSLFKMATAADKPNVTAAIFWLKARAGWEDGRSPVPRDEPPGKKVIAERAARGAQDGTAWAEIMAPQDTPLQ